VIHIIAFLRGIIATVKTTDSSDNINVGPAMPEL
jgi:hypothetical protein